MANTKHSTEREIIIDRLLQKRRGYSVYEMLEIVNESLSFEGFPPVSLTTIRRDIETIKCRYRMCLEEEKRSHNVYFRYADPTFTIFNNVLTPGELQHLHTALLSIRFIDPILGTLIYKDISERLSHLLDIDPASDPIVLYKQLPSRANWRKYRALYQHIRTKTPATIIYTPDGDESEQEILVHPYFILYDCSDYYLLCHNASNDTAAKIPISTIQRMVSSPETEFIPNKDFPLQDFYTKHLSKD